MVNLSEKIKLNSYSPPKRIEEALGRNSREISAEEAAKYRKLTNLRSLLILNSDIHNETMDRITNEMNELYADGYMPAAVYVSPDGKFYI